MVTEHVTYGIGASADPGAYFPASGELTAIHV
jgi:hypothetical protein